jgi:hypothetical protein
MEYKDMKAQLIKNRFKKIRKTTTAFFLALVITLGFAGNSAEVFAIPDVPYYSGNDILYYDPDDFGSCATGGGSLSGVDTKEKVWNYLLQKDLTPEQAAGIMGNMQAESGINPTRHQGTGDIWNSNFTGNAWGIVQWDGGRRFSSPDGGVLGQLRKERPQLEKYTAVEYDTVRNPDADIPAEDFDALLLFELEFMYKESTNRPVTEDRYGTADSEWEMLKKLTSLEEATVFWHNNFEVSSDSPERVLENRGGAARDILNELGGTTTSGRANNESCVAGGDFEKLVAAYAWPDPQGQGYTEKKPEYETAVQEAKDDNRYTGDVCYGGGVDCGAFTTLLITNSGHDPEFNHGGKISEGAGYTRIQQDWAIANWEEVGSGSDINVADLQSGDVAFRPNHTFVFVKDVQGFETQIASASQCGRSPMEGLEDPTASNITW